MSTTTHPHVPNVPTVQTSNGSRTPELHTRSVLSQRGVPGPAHGMGRLAFYSFRKLLTNPFSLGFAIFLPIFMYLMFGANQSYSEHWQGSANVAATVLVNMTIYGTIMTASSMGANVSLERTSGISRLFAMTPMSSTAQILARVIASLGISAVVIAVTYVVGYLTGARMHPQAWLVSAAMIIVLSILPATIGLAAGFTVRSDGAFSVTSAITVIGSFASGMFIPLEQMGSFFQHLAPWTPLYGIVQLVQMPLAGWGFFTWTWVLNYAVWTLFFVALASWSSRRDTGR